MGRARTQARPYGDCSGFCVENANFLSCRTASTTASRPSL